MKIQLQTKGITYKTLPAIKIGRLAIDDRHLRKGYGTVLLEFSYTIAKHVSSNISGCRFLILDAKRNNENDPIHFYKKFGFRILKEREKGTTPMYMDIYLSI